MANMHIMRRPGKEFLAEYGIECKVSQKGGVTWYNLKECPICLKKGYQCGLSESFDEFGKSVKGFKCQHVDGVNAKDFYAALGCSDLDVQTISRSNRNAVVHKKEIKKTDSVDSLPLASNEAMAVYQKRLKENKAAMDYLLGRGLTKKTIEYFRLGVSKPYIRKDDGLKTDNALIFPLFNRNIQPVKKNAFYNIPGLTENPRDPNGWMSGSISTYYGGNPVAKIAFACEGPKDLWMLYQYLQGSSLKNEFLLLTSTHGKHFPEEWKHASFWKRFDKVFFGQDNDIHGDEIVSNLIGLICRDAFRVRVPKVFGKDWTDFFGNGATIDDFQSLITKAPPATYVIEENDNHQLQMGLMAYKPVDINGSFHCGHLHYTVQALKREKAVVKEKDGSEREIIHETLETVVVRSDGALLTPFVQPAPARTDASRHVIRLSDGTLISKIPTPSLFASWNWASIKRFQHAKAAGEKIEIRPLSLMVRDILNYIENRIWLPHPEDYILLAFAAVATYVQTIFDAVPLLLVNGPRNTGKTEIGMAMLDVCANATLIGQGTSASIARRIDTTRGFVVIDDLEAIGNKGDGQFSELIQGLKLSYKKSTATKIWTDVKTMRVEELNFFGIKMANNTTGVDAILGSRMFVIQTRKRLPQETEIWEANRVKVTEPPPGLRSELHTWAFESCQKVANTYQLMYSQGNDRSDEIAAPLRVIAELSGDKELQSILEAGLARQTASPRHNDDPIELLEEALNNIVIEGYRSITIQHVALEMKKLTPDNYGQERTNDIPECFRPEWIGRQLRSQGMVNVETKRIRLHGMNLRAYEVSDAFVKSVADVLEKMGRELVVAVQQTLAFCQGCEGCQYKNAGCDIMPRRLDAEIKIKPR